jgi:pimeloyl-ACP methyl ester carboxylesterase
MCSAAPLNSYQQSAVSIFAMTVTRIFIHGLESSSRGAKARFLSERYPDILTPDFTGTLSERMAKLKGILSDISDIILVGSSFGGLMATLYGLEHEARVRKIVLFAPALNFDPSLSDTSQRIHVPTWLYIGKHDEITPHILVEPIAQSLFSALHYLLMDDDHFLCDTFPRLNWSQLLNETYTL